MRLQGAIFDMDGTLLASMHAWKSLGGEMARRHGIPITGESRVRLSNLMAPETLTYLRDVHGIHLTREGLQAEVLEYMKEFYATRVELKPGARELLERLREKGVKMYLATATNRDLAEVALCRTGITELFEGIITCREVGSGKENSPEIYEQALARLGTAKEDTVVFEDAAYAVRTACRAGFRVAAVYDPLEHDTQEELRRLAETYITDFPQWLKNHRIE